jgi:hypothetical protein
VPLFHADICRFFIKVRYISRQHYFKIIQVKLKIGF